MGATLRIAIFLALSCIANAQQYRRDPVAILKQINRHNEDGSYSYGYEGADGSFKIETKYPTGEVQGKYGYVDDNGKVREVEYGASARGFEPVGAGINVPPPTLNSNYVGPDGYDDGQYREDPSVYYKDERYNTKVQKSYNSNPAPRPYNPPAPKTYNPEPAPEYYDPPVQQYNPPAPRYNPPAPQYNPPAPQYNPPATQYRAPAPQYNPPQQSYYRPPANRQPVDPSLYGSYSVVY